MGPLNRIAAAALLAAAWVGSVSPPAAAAGASWHRSLVADLHIAADGTWRERQVWDVRVDTGAAARVAADQTFGFSKELERVALVEAYTRKPDGTEIAVASDAVLSRTLAAGDIDFPTFSDWRIRTIVFPDVRPGDTVHYVLLRRSRAPLFFGAYEATLDGGPRANVASADIRITLPATMHLAVAAHGLSETAPVRVDGRVRRAWHLRPDGQAHDVSLEVSSFPNYAALGDAFAARALPAARPTAPIRALAARLTRGIAGRRAQAARLYTYVADRVRYVGIQYGAGRVVPDPAAVIAARAYGDCKDHVALLQALLAARGIFSEPALISTRSRYTLPQPPTLALLEHVLLFVPEFDLFLDPTSPYSAFGALPFEDADKPVVLAGAGGARLGRTPPLLPGEAVTKTRTVAVIAADGSVTGRTVTRASGAAAVALREVASGIEEDGGESVAADALRRLGTPGHGDFDFAPPRGGATIGGAYALTARFRLPRDTADTDGGRFSLPAGLPVLLRGGSFLVSRQSISHGRHLCFAGRQVEDIRVALPAGAVVAHLPPDVRVGGGAGRYSAGYAVAQGAIEVRRDFVLATTRPVCSPAEYRALRPVLRAMHRDLRAEIAIRQAPAVAAASSPSPAPPAQSCAAGGTGCRVASGDAVGGPQSSP